jgi:hypothetical protein
MMALNAFYTAPEYQPLIPLRDLHRTVGCQPLSPLSVWRISANI